MSEIMINRKQFMNRLADLLDEYNVTFKLNSRNNEAILSILDENSLQLFETVSEEILTSELLRYYAETRTKFKIKIA